jgi:hypothetical protein
MQQVASSCSGAIVVANDRRPGVQKTQVTTQVGAHAGSGEVKTLRITLQVQPEVVADREKLSALDSEIKRDTKALCKEIDSVDYISVGYASLRHFGPIPFYETQYTEAVRPEQIP